MNLGKVVCVAVSQNQARRGFTAKKNTDRDRKTWGAHVLVFPLHGASGVRPAQDAPERKRPMPETSKSWRCRLGRHRWHRIYDHQQARPLKECRDCGKRMIYGAPRGLGGISG